MRRSRTAAVVAAGVVAAATGLLGAGPASAATPQVLCVSSYPACAIAENGSSNVWMLIYASEWLYNGADHPGQIQLSGTSGASLCMQLDHAAGNTVIYATCNGASYQKWDGFDIGGNEGFISEWDTSQCLTFNEEKHYLDTVACNGAWYQQFSPHAD